MRLRRLLISGMACLALGAGAAVVLPGVVAAGDNGVRVARGQIIVHTDSQQAHVIPSPAGDPNTYLQLELFQDFTGDFTGSGTAIFIATVHRDGTLPDGTITFTGREAEFGTLFGHRGAFYFDDSDGLVTPQGKVSGQFTSDGGILGFQRFHAAGSFFPTAHPTITGNLSHTVDYQIRAHFG
jgi:hypothetical protein